MDAGGARVVVEQSLFRLTVTDGTGQTVLSRGRPRGRGHDPGADDRGPDLHGQGQPGHHDALLAAVVPGGLGDPTQYPSQEWIANLKSGTRSGTWYSAQDVEEVEHDGEDLVLTLGTNDPSGRQLVVRIGPEGGDAVRVRAEAVPSDGVAMLGDSFTTSATPGPRTGSSASAVATTTSTSAAACSPAS